MKNLKMNDVWNSDVSGTTKRCVFLALAYLSELKGQKTKPTAKVVAKIVGCSERSAREAMKFLEKNGYVKWGEK